MHPLARPGNTTRGGGFSAGQRVVIYDGRRGVADEITNDGEALISLDDGVCLRLRWDKMSPETGPPEALPVQAPNKWPDDFRLVDGEYQPTREPWEI